MLDRMIVIRDREGRVVECLGAVCADWEVDQVLEDWGGKEAELTVADETERTPAGMVREPEGWVYLTGEPVFDHEKEEV